MPFCRSLLLALLLPLAAQALDLHVAPQGDDRASGKAPQVLKPQQNDRPELNQTMKP